MSPSGTSIDRQSITSKQPPSPPSAPRKHKNVKPHHPDLDNRLTLPKERRDQAHNSPNDHRGAHPRHEAPFEPQHEVRLVALRQRLLQRVRQALVIVKVGFFRGRI